MRIENETDAFTEHEISQSSEGAALNILHSATSDISIQRKRKRSGKYSEFI